MYALKIINKMDVINRKLFTSLKNEKDILTNLDSPFLTNLDYCF